MLKELDRAAEEPKISRQAVIKLAFVTRWMIINSWCLSLRKQYS